jgi:hypothetical protein
MKNIALITGASSGIGYELAHLHAQKKGDLVLVARSTTKLQSMKEELEKTHQIEVMVIPKDLSIPDSAREVYDQVKAAGIEVDYLINNAGFGDFGFFHETDWEKEEMMINLNIMSLTHLTKLFGTDMVTRKSGKIMNLSSTAAFQPGPLMSIYYATKHYVQAFSEGIANEWKDHGVTVTALCPGPTASGFQATADIEESKLVKGRKLPTSKEVAIYGYDAMMKGKMVAIHGTLNKILAGSTKFMPRKMVLNTVRKMQEKDH